MRDILKNKKIIIIAIILILIAGTVMLFVKGFNKSIQYQAATRIECYIPSGYEKADMKNIVNEVFSDKNVQIQEVEKLSQIVSIKIKDYTKEEMDNFKTKISEKYGIEKDNIESYEIDIPTTRISSIVLPYLFPVSLVTAVSLIYLAIKNMKDKEIIKKICKVIVYLIVVAGLYFSSIVLTRIPVNEYMMPIALVLYITTLLISTMAL